MPATYKAITAALAFTGSLSLILSGELNPVFIVPGLAMLPGYFRYMKGAGPAPRWAIGGLSIVALMVLGFEVFVLTDDYLVAVAHMTIAFQALKSFDLRNPWDPLQVYFMSLLQLVIYSELALSMLYVVVFVVFLVVLVAAMVFSHFQKEGAALGVRLRRPVFKVTAFVMVLTLVLFVAVPRVRSGFISRKHSRGIRSVGFTERVDLGSFGEVLENPTVVMRAEVTGDGLPLYWRGVTLDYFDGVSWSDTMKGLDRVYRRRGAFSLKGGPDDPMGPGYTVQRITAEPMDTTVMFGLGEIYRVEAPAYILYTDRSGSLYLSAKSFRRLSYTVYSKPGQREVDYEFIWKYLQIPAGMQWMEAMVSGLITEDMDPMARARRVEAWLRNNFEYSLRTSPPPRGVTPLEDFLLNTKKGYCEHFASAMVMMLRTARVPARIVTGFSGGDENALGDYIIVRQSNAHSWVEAAVGGRWVRFDPTPLVPGMQTSFASLYLDSVRMWWYRYVIGFGRADQLSLWRMLSTPAFSLPAFPGMRVGVSPVYLAVLLPLALLIVLRYVPRGRAWFRSYPPETRLYLRFRKKVRKLGGRVGDSATPEDVLREAVARSVDEGAAREFVRLYEEARFGSRRPDPRMRELYRRLMSAR